MGPLLFVADAHLTRDDPEVDAFVSFLRVEGRKAATLCILGDLFNIWLGKPKFALPHHLRVLDALEELRSAGVRLLYVEGNRDFHLRRTHLGRPFTAVTEDSLVETYAGRRFHLAHGDAINSDDRQYRAWKAISKSSPVYGAFSLLPARAGMRLGERLERTLAGTNLRNRARFPMEHCLAYARKVFEEGSDAHVLGHFHEEKHIAFGEGEGRPLGVYVMPAFRLGHRYLIVEGDAAPRFASFSAPPVPSRDRSAGG
jgi:UDP-2,3-diacylglucosamine hydrolase